MSYLLHIRRIIMKWTSSMNHCFERRVSFHHFVKGVFLGDIFDNGELELVSGEVFICVFYLLSFFLRADGYYHRVAILR